MFTGFARGDFDARAIQSATRKAGESSNRVPINSKIFPTYRAYLECVFNELTNKRSVKDVAHSLLAQTRFEKIREQKGFTFSSDCAPPAKVKDVEAIDWGGYCDLVDQHDDGIDNLQPTCDTNCGAICEELYSQYNPQEEIFSRKVFICGMPVRIDEEELIQSFSAFGPVQVDWPNKENYPFFPPKDFAFLTYESEQSVRLLQSRCIRIDSRLYYDYATQQGDEPTFIPIHVRPWRLADADYITNPEVTVDIRRVAFIGGVPRHIRAVELAHALESLFGPVLMVSIDIGIEDKYPKGAARVAFACKQDFMKAVRRRFISLGEGDTFRETEIKPYILEDQPCDECGLSNYNGRETIYFCSDFVCLSYYCDECWMRIHSNEHTAHHRPVMKDDGDITVHDKLFECAADYGTDWENAARCMKPDDTFSDRSVSDDDC